MSKQAMWMPSIYYEESNDGVTGGLPFINVPYGKSMPSCLFVCEAKDYRELSEETKADLDNIEKEIVIHSYANMTVLKEKLDPDTFDIVRTSLGLQPLQQAIKEGLKKTYEIQKNVDTVINRINQLSQKEEEENVKEESTN
jgi:hypothetical protein